MDEMSRSEVKMIFSTGQMSLKKSLLQSKGNGGHFAHFPAHVIPGENIAEKVRFEIFVNGRPEGAG